ncbi:uncharacterized protein BDW43DRAFT_127214 [Aspergillus alliaceus]|uniref:uncharacterized protein n=1 Tax=Petromyces alliaceus TaxID=209559 RepID=UPI0012A3C746|nr:uncharacterized protein BDW43DRAFT_127214 [Aspergillus alliaceus]KAB8232150.1 hypothetical protein BDW43DRAFT_127214 [Aspergillus alliaceus]
MHANGSAPRAMVDFDQFNTRALNTDTPDHSVHVRSRSTAHTQSPKRLSVFSSRSRSNTTTSTTSSRRSPASSMTSVDAASLPSSQDERTGSAAGVRSERQESMTKSLFSRGSRILRRQGSKFNIVATLDEEDEMEREKPRFEVTDLFGRHHRSRQSDAHEQLKSLISDPFDFHHLTHTSPSHFQEMDRARENDLVTEFSAIRASQRPVTGLKGIRAEDLHFRDFSSENLTNCGTAIAEDHAVPLPISPPGSPGATSAASPKQEDSRLRRESRVCENFSRPYPRVGATTPPLKATTPGLAASPEISEPAPRAIDEILGLSSPPTYPEHVYSSGDDVHDGPLLHMNVDSIFPSTISQPGSPRTEKDLNDFRKSSVSFTNMSSDLDDVPEEEEAINWPSSLMSSEETTSRIQSPLEFPQTELQAASIVNPRSNLSIYVTEELSQKVAEALGSPTLPQYCQPEVPPQDQRLGDIVKRSASVRRRATYETIYESWDADIDYCYEHAAESNCDFDWGRNSLDEPQQEAIGIPVMNSELDPVDEAFDDYLLPAVHLSTSAMPTLGLEHNSSRSLPGEKVSLAPPTEVGVSQRNSDYFQPVSSMFSAALGKHLTHDTLYEEYLATDAESDRHFSFYSQGVIQPMEQPVSPRSSFSPISKCNSEESLILSRAASIVRKHRSSVSTTSVPELVHSLANSRELSAVDQVTSGEQSLSSGTGRPESSSYHRQTKSLAREMETQTLFRAECGIGLESGLVSIPAPSTHDRAKSTSEVEAASPLAKATKVEVPTRGTHRRKGRASYSLFPSAAASNVP